MSTAFTDPPPPPGHGRGLRWWQWVIVIVVAIIVVFVVGLWLLLHNGTVHRYVLNRARSEAAAALGGPVEIGDYGLRFSGVSPTVDVYRVVVPGTPLPEAHGEPLLSLDHAHVSIAVTSLLHRAWHISDLELDHPVVHFVQTPDGRTNLPELKQNNGPGPNLFDLGIRHAVIRQGEVFVNSRPSQVAADLRGVHLEARYDPATRRYTGQFGYSDGSVQFQDFRSIPHALALNFIATPSGAEVPHLQLTSGHTQVTASVTLSSYTQPVIHTSYRATVDVAELGHILRNPGLPAGTVAITGTASYAAGGKGEFLDRLQAQGQFTSRQLTATVAGLSTPVRQLRGKYELAQGTLNVQPVSAQVAGGTLSARLSIRDLAGAARAQLNVQVRGARLEQVARYAGATSTTLGQAGVSGGVDANADVRWSGGLDHLTAAVTASLNAAIAAGGPAPIPVTGSVEAHLQDNRLTLTSAQVQTPLESVSAHGTLATSGPARAAIQFDWQARDLGETEAITAHVVQGLNGTTVPALNLAGSGSFTGTLGGSLSSPVVNGRLQLQPLSVRGTHWRSVSAAIEASASQFRLENAVLLAPTPAAAPGAGRVEANLSAGLSDWSYKGSDPLQLTLHVGQMPLQQLAPALEPALGQKLPVVGSFTLDATLQGSADNPQGQGSFSMAPARVEAGSVAEPLRSVHVDFQTRGAGSGVAISASLNAVLPAGTVTGSGTYFLHENRYQAELRAAGLDLAKLQTVQRRKIPVTGDVTIAGSGVGLTSNPEFQVSLTSPQLDVQGQPITDLNVTAHLADHAVHATLTTSAVNTVMRGEADIRLTDGYPATARLDTGAIPLATALAAFAPGLAADIHGRTEVHATVAGPLKNIEQVQAHLTLPVLQVNYDNTLQVAATAPIHVDLANGVATLQPFTIAGTDTNLQVGGSIPVAGHNPIKVTAVGTVDLKLIHAFVPDLTTAGEARLNLNASGALTNPTATGDIQVTRLSVTNPDWPVGVQNANGTLRLNGDRLNIANFTATVGGGKLTATGGVVLRPALRFDLGVSADQVRMQFPPTVRETLGATLALSGTPEQATLSGRVRLEDLSVTPQFDFTQVLSQFSGVTTVAPPGSFTQNLTLNISVTTPNQIRAVSRDFSLQANANLTVRGTAAEPTVLGRVNINSGDLIFRGDRYVLSSGTLDFVNPTQIQPVVNISADTTIQQYDLHLHFAGPANNLRTSYTSDPALPPADIINLLAFGTTTEASAANPSPGNLGAENLIASAVSSQITDRVQKIAGISQLSVDPILGGGQQNPGARVTVQQRVTANLFVTISTDVTSTQRNVIEIQYQVSPTMSISGVRDQNGGFGVSTRFKKTW